MRRRIKNFSQLLAGPNETPMLLTVSTTHTPATDLGYILHKNPARVHTFRQSYGTAHVFYPEATQQRCTAALLVEVDPIGLVRNRRGDIGPAGLLGQYVNDRPYAASSLLSVAIADVFGSALNGRCADRPLLVSERFPLEFHLPALPGRGGPALLRSLFEPLYAVDAVRLPLDERFPQWGDSWYHDTRLQTTTTVQDALAHLYVLIPVLDNDKHYWVGESEVEKLLRHGEGWLSRHPEREVIVQRYLKHRRSLARLALDRLLEADGVEAETDLDDEVEVARSDTREQTLEKPLSQPEARRPQEPIIPRADPFREPVAGARRRKKSGGAGTAALPPHPSPCHGNDLSQYAVDLVLPTEVLRSRCGSSIPFQ